jgi:hypothetical protein
LLIIAREGDTDRSGGADSDHVSGRSPVLRHFEEGREK